MIGAGIGGLQYMRTGSLEKGLMAGLGAYGGAGLGTSLMGAGATAARVLLPDLLPELPGANCRKNSRRFCSRKSVPRSCG
jgi:hypothetical protein